MSQSITSSIVLIDAVFNASLPPARRSFVSREFAVTTGTRIQLHARSLRKRNGRDEPDDAQRDDGCLDNADHIGHERNRPYLLLTNTGDADMTSFTLNIALQTASTRGRNHKRSTGQESSQQERAPA